MSGPIKFRILAIVGVISMFHLPALFFTHSTDLTDFYSRKVMCIVWLALSAASFS